jgi:hypothetical protein
VFAKIVKIVIWVNFIMHFGIVIPANITYVWIALLKDFQKKKRILRNNWLI